MSIGKRCRRRAGLENLLSSRKREFETSPAAGDVRRRRYRLRGWWRTRLAVTLKDASHLTAAAPSRDAAPVVAEVDVAAAVGVVVVVAARGREVHAVEDDALGACGAGGAGACACACAGACAGACACACAGGGGGGGGAEGEDE